MKHNMKRFSSFILLKLLAAYYTIKYGRYLNNELGVTFCV